MKDVKGDCALEMKAIARLRCTKMVTDVIDVDDNVIATAFILNDYLTFGYHKFIGQQWISTFGHRTDSMVKFGFGI